MVIKMKRSRSKYMTLEPITYSGDRYVIKMHDFYNRWAIFDKKVGIFVITAPNKKTAEEYLKLIHEDKFYNKKPYEDCETDEERIQWLNNSLIACRETLWCDNYRIKHGRSYPYLFIAKEETEKKIKIIEKELKRLRGDEK